MSTTHTTFRCLDGYLVQDRDGGLTCTGCGFVLGQCVSHEAEWRTFESDKEGRDSSAVNPERVGYGDPLDGTHTSAVPRDKKTSSCSSGPQPEDDAMECTPSSKAANVMSRMQAKIRKYPFCKTQTLDAAIKLAGNYLVNHTIPRAGECVYAAAFVVLASKGAVSLESMSTKAAIEQVKLQAALSKVSPRDRRGKNTVPDISRCLSASDFTNQFNKVLGLGRKTLRLANSIRGSAIKYKICQSRNPKILVATTMIMATLNAKPFNALSEHGVSEQALTKMYRKLWPFRMYLFPETYEGKTNVMNLRGFDYSDEEMASIGREIDRIVGEGKTTRREWWC